MYRIDHDSQAGILRLIPEGFWDAATVDRLSEEIRPIARRIKASGRPLLVLSDARNFPVQSQAVMDRFARFDTMIGVQPDRLAIVSGSVLVKLQGERIDMANARFFTTPTEAEAWLRE